MGWYFYGKGGSILTPKSTLDLSIGSIVLSFLPTPNPSDLDPNLGAPEGYVFCNGQSLSKNINSEYYDLYTIIGGLYSETPLTFAVPDMRGLMPRGVTDPSEGIGDSGGSLSHTHTFLGHSHVYDISNHTHDVDVHSHTASHTHDLVSHQHYGLDYYLTNSDSNYIANQVVPEQVKAARNIHDHNDASNQGFSNLGGLTNPPGSSSGADYSSMETVNYNLTSLTAANPPAQSTGDASGSQVSSSFTGLPPFITLSFLMKAY